MDGFIIVGNTCVSTYEEIFPYIKEDKMWVGATNYNVGMLFTIPDSYEKYHHIENGKKIGRVSTSCWWTNIENKRRNETLDFYKKYSNEYLKFDTYDAINVDNYKDIPMDYDGVMGVPMTFLGHYNPAQFEIVGKLNHNRPQSYDFGKPIIGGKNIFARLLIRRKNYD